MVKAFYVPCTYKEPPEATTSVGMYPKIGSSMYSKRGYTPGIRGQLYETKLLSLLYFRAIHDETIQEFQLVTNLDKIGAFDDICFKAKVKGHNKPVIMFIQAKHRENKKQALKIDLATYFDSYMKIRQNFNWVFKGTFNETECLFIIFTNANVDYSDASATSGLPARLNDLLDMGGMIKQPNSEENIEYLTKKRVKDQISSLAKWLVEFINDDKNFELMLSNELFLRYHVILAKKVVNISDIQPLKRYRIASFRQDFFDNNEEYIMLFRDTLYLEVTKRRRRESTESEIPVILTEFLADPTDATRLSKLIGTVVTYNNGQLKFNKQSTKTFRPNIKQMDVSQSTVNKAVELAAIEILSSVKFKVPVAFGNKDLTLSDAKIERRICYLAFKIKELLDKCKSSKVVTIDESLEYGFLKLNGGIAGGIGNIFVLDENTKLMKITNNCDTLGTHAKSLYTKLKSEVHNLHEYQFYFKVYKFPKLSFDYSHYEKKMARDFLNKILVYCNQAEENELQEILKNEIEDIQRNQPNYFQAKTDAILLRYYDEIQKWWMRTQHESYLSPKIDLFRQLIDDIIKDPLMRSINLTYTSKIKQHDYTFTEDAVRSLNLQDQLSSTIIIAENCVLTVVKVLQHLENKDHVVLDVKYIASLPTNDLNALRVELMNTIKEKVLILVCDRIDSKDEMKTLKNIAEAVINKRNIIVTDPKSLQIIMTQKYFPEADKILHDKKFSLIDVCKESQKSIIESATVVFPGVELRLEHLVKDWPNTGLTSAGEADAAGVAAATDKPTVTGMEHHGVVESLSSPPRQAEKLSIVERAQKLSKPSISPDKDALYYDMSGEKYLIIINQTIFFKYQPPTRKGQDLDVVTLKKVFGDLGFKDENIFEFKNLKYEEIIKNLTEIASKDHSKTSCVCITILTRADNGSKVHAADKPYLLGDVFDIFAKEKSLVNKPKLFFVQACRGANMDAGITVDLDSHSDSGFTTPVVTHADFFLLSATGEDRTATNGSWMIQMLCYYIEIRNHLQDLLEIVTLIHRINNTMTNKKYMLTTWSTLTKRLKF